MITVCKKDIARGLTDIGLKQGDVVIVHTSLKSLGYVCGPGNRSELGCGKVRLG